MIAEITTPPTACPRREGVWDYISPSRLSLWAKCPLAFKFRYVDGVPSPTSPSLFVGKLCHAALEVFYRHRQLGVTLDAEAVTRRLAVLWNRAIEEENASRPNAKDAQHEYRPFSSHEEAAKAKRQVEELARAYLAWAPADEPRPRAVETRIETPLVDPADGEDLGISLLGVLDVVLDAAEGPIIVDFKTTGNSAEPPAVAYETQLSAYAYLLRHTSGKRESELQIRGLVKTKQPKILVHRFPPRDETHFARLFSLIREYLDALDSGRFNYRPGWTCSTCDFCKTHCPRWTG